MRKIILLAGIFTFFMNGLANANYYNDRDEFHNQQVRYEWQHQRKNTGYYDKHNERTHYANVQRQPSRYRRLTREDERVYNERNMYEEDYDVSQIRPYIGLDVSTSKIDFGRDEWVVDDYNGGYEYHDNKNEALSFVVGAKINKNFGIEAFYQTSNENEKKYYWDDGVYEEDKLSYTAMGVDAIAYMPINQEFELLAALGLAQYDFETKYEDVDEEFGNLGGESKDFDSLGIRFGIGGQYNFNEHFALRAMAHYIKMTDDKYIKSMTELSMGIRYMF